ncbi:ankyrin repeat and IBR domain-containing protein 1-like [Planoprotostelium fungivorum]|uniref:RBR-type E3 ubiquitin transferase n=1 Tax=Planoprotostelium fungivorum TaxID=1890364 RepID=A0A2P6NAU2_9EUKA|nr:ankyrin repeat and IBR domain-containing protein 1-like [Planoprotostelium fungivorum]
MLVATLTLTPTDWLHMIDSESKSHRKLVDIAGVVDRRDDDQTENLKETISAFDRFRSSLVKNIFGNRHSSPPVPATPSSVLDSLLLGRDLLCRFDVLSLKGLLASRIGGNFSSFSLNLRIGLTSLCTDFSAWSTQPYRGDCPSTEISWEQLHQVMEGRSPSEQVHQEHPALFGTHTVTSLLSNVLGPYVFGVKRSRADLIVSQNAVHRTEVIVGSPFKEEEIFIRKSMLYTKGGLRPNLWKAGLCANVRHDHKSAHTGDPSINERDEEAIDHSFGKRQPLPLEECIEAQNGEMTVIESYFGEDIVISQSLPLRFSVRLSNDYDMGLSAIFLWPAKYPSVPPEVIIRCPSTEEIESLEQFVDMLALRDMDTITMVELIEKRVKSHVLGYGKKREDDVTEYTRTFQDLTGCRYDIISPDTVATLRDKMIEEVSNRLKVSKSDATTILIRFRWDAERLKREHSEALRDHSVEGFFSNKLGFNREEERKEITLEDVTSSYECLVCCDSMSYDQVSILPCGHQFCDDCYSTYLCISIDNGGASNGMNCPAHRCQRYLDNVFICSLVPDYTSYRRYISLSSKSFSSSNSSSFHCPSPSCEYQIHCKTPSTIGGFQCACGEVFCNQCQGSLHWPVACEEYKLYVKEEEEKLRARYQSQYQMEKKKLEEVISTLAENYIKSMTKKCPRCTSNIEKNGGCNHMSCSRCSFQFCWMCGENWATTHYGCTHVVQWWTDDKKAPAPVPQIQEIVTDQPSREDEWKQDALLRGRVKQTLKQRTMKGIIDANHIEILRNLLEMIAIARQISNNCISILKAEPGKKSNHFKSLSNKLRELIYIASMNIDDHPDDRQMKSHIKNFISVFQQMLQTTKVKSKTQVQPESVDLEKKDIDSILKNITLAFVQKT